MALLVLAALCSCTDNDATNAIDTNPNFPQDGVIRVVTNVGTPETRAGITADDIEIFNLNIENKSDANYSYYATILGSNTNGWTIYEGDGSTPLTMLWKNSTTPVTVTALNQKGLVIVTKEEFNSEQTCSVESDQKTDMGIQRSDLLYMKPTEVNPATDLVDGKLKVSFVHLFSKINLTLTLGTEFNTVPGTDSNPITGITVNGAKREIFFNTSTEELKQKDDSSPEAIIPWYDAATCYTAGSGNTKNAVAKYEVILPPQTMQSGSFSIFFTLNGKSYKWTSTTENTFESGKAYTLNLTVGKNVVIMGAISANAWETGTPDNNGNLETE